jgi:hypothetical protein
MAVHIEFNFVSPNTRVLWGGKLSPEHGYETGH